VKTDSYAFVQMADEEGFRKITKDAVRLFGIQMQVREMVFFSSPISSSVLFDTLIDASASVYRIDLAVIVIVFIFSLLSQNKSCRVLMAQTYKGFWVDVGQNQSVAEAIYSLK